MLLTPLQCQQIATDLDRSYRGWREFPNEGSRTPLIISPSLFGQYYIVIDASDDRVFDQGTLSIADWWTAPGGEGASIKACADILESLRTTRRRGFLHLHRYGQHFGSSGPRGAAHEFFTHNPRGNSYFFPISVCRDGSQRYPWTAIPRRI